MFCGHLTYTTRFSDTENSVNVFIIRDFNFLNTVIRMLKGNQERKIVKREIQGNYVTLTVRQLL